MASCFDTYFLEDDICAIHEAVGKNKYQENDKL